MTDPDPKISHDPTHANAVRKVVLVGHCGFDQASLGRAVASALPGITVESAHDTDSLERLATPDALLLINRVLDGRFDTASGIDLISELARCEQSPRLMLISNYPDAQAQAVQAGALPGFGKSGLGSPETGDKLREAGS